MNRRALLRGFVAGVVAYALRPVASLSAVVASGRVAGGLVERVTIGEISDGHFGLKVIHSNGLVEIIDG